MVKLTLPFFFSLLETWLESCEWHMWLTLAAHVIFRLDDTGLVDRHTQESLQHTRQMKSEGTAAWGVLVGVRQMSQKLTKGREETWVGEPCWGGREINQIDKQRASLSEKNRLYRGDYVVRELGTESWGFMKPSESEEQSKGLVFIITKWLPPPRDGIQNWDIEALSGDNPLLCILEVQSASLGGVSQRN